MCRIAGMAGALVEQPEQAVARMCESMHRGGPDDSGMHVDAESKVYLGHRRLSIIDLSPGGHQPMQDMTGMLTISYNGEIYNYMELRTELEAKGFKFKSESDTEVLLLAFLNWGEAAFAKLNGMFSFALHDKRDESLWLVRDHSGIKPLYYYSSAKGLMFASEVRAFTHSGLKIYENPDWKYYFFAYGFVPEPYTTLANVKMLPAGCYLKYDVRNRTGQLQSYVKFEKSDELITDVIEAREQIRAVITRAVSRHLISDAPIGVFLSGGVDSSLITLLAARQLGNSLKSLSIIFDESDYSEQKYQHIITGITRGEHKECLIGRVDFEEGMQEVYHAMDQPSIDGINTFFIARCAKEMGLKAVLSGIGADELFGGYPSFARTAHMPFTSKLPSVITRLAEHSPANKFRKISYLGGTSTEKRYLFNRALFSPATIAGLLDTSVADVENKLFDGAMKEFGKENHEAEIVSWMETNVYMKNQLLKDTDYMSMWHSVEVRVPFLDVELRNLITKIDSKILYSGSYPKSLLIDSFSDVLPEQIWRRPKKGFEFPFGKWFEGSGIFNTLDTRNHTVDRLQREFKNGKLHWSGLWALHLAQGGFTYKHEPERQQAHV